MADIKVDDKIYQLKLKEIENLNDVLEYNRNPHPLMVAVITTIIIFILTWFADILIKPDISGIWNDDEDNRFKLSKWKFQNKVILYMLDKKTNNFESVAYGTIRGDSYVDLVWNDNDINLVWDYNDIILVIQNSMMKSKWYRVLKG